MKRAATLEADVAVARGMRLMFEAGVDLSRRVLLDVPGYLGFSLLGAEAIDGRYRWRIDFVDAALAREARADLDLAARIGALVADCLNEPLVFTLYVKAVAGDRSDEQPRPPARDASPAASARLASAAR